MVPFVSTPLFLLQSVVDQWQLGNVLGTASVGLGGRVFERGLWDLYTVRTLVLLLGGQFFRFIFVLDFDEKHIY